MVQLTISLISVDTLLLMVYIWQTEQAQIIIIIILIISNADAYNHYMNKNNILSQKQMLGLY